MQAVLRYVSGLTAGAIGVALGACAQAPVPAETALPRQVEVVRGWNDPSVASAFATLTPEPVDAGMLNSTESLAAALTYSPELALLRAQTALAEADVTRARQRHNPVLNLSPEHLIGAAHGISPWVIALSLVWPLRTAGKRDLDIEQALAMNDAALLDAANAVWSLRASARAAVCALELATGRHALAAQEGDLRADLAARLDKQAEAGIVSRYDAARARLESDQSLQRLRDSEAALENARFDLAQVTGLPRHALGERRIGSTCLPAPAMPADSVHDLEDDAIAARLDLRAGLARYRAADAVLRGEMARRYPDIDIGPGYVYDQGDRRITLSLSAELPIFARNDAGIARAAAERDRAAADVDKLQWSVRYEVERAHALLALRAAQYSDAQRLDAQSRSLVERDRARQQAGEIDQPAVITSRLGALNAGLDLLAARQSLIEAMAALESAMQRPLNPPYFDGAAASAFVQPKPTPESN